MPSVRDLVYLNRDLRRQLQKGLSTHPGPFDGHLWPILYLAVKIMRHHEALELLAGREYGVEAGILLRTMFEATVNLLWISRDIEPRLKRYAAYQVFDSQKYRDASRKWNAGAHLSELEKEELRENFEQLDQQAQGIRDEYGFKYNEHWSGKSLRALAKEVGWLERYDLLYRLYSDVTHSNIVAAREYISVDGSGKVRVNSEPQVEHCKACLCEAYVYLWAAFDFLDIVLDLSMESIVEKAGLHFPTA